MIKKQILFPSIAVVLVGVSAFGVMRASAETSSTPFSGLAQAIAQKFNLNQNDVQSVVDDWHTKQRTQMEEKMKENLSTRLDSLVTEGKLTAAQKQAIVDKFSQVKGDFNKDELKDKTPEERRALMNQKKTDLENWAKSQGIDLSLLPEILGGHHMRMGGVRRGMFQPSPTPTP